MSGSPCCPSDSWGSPPPDGGYQHKGHYEEVAGVKCYVSGDSPAKVVILSFSDVFDCLLDRKREVCDQLAAAIPNSQVIAPDYFKGHPIMDVVPPSWSEYRCVLGMLLSTPRIMYRMMWLHTWSSLGPMLEDVTKVLRKRHPDAHFLCYGYCFGGYVVCKVCSYLGFSAGLSYHPSPQVCQMQPAQHKQSLQELASGVRCPVLLLPAGNDSPSVKEGGDFVGWLPTGSASHTFEKMKHGYMSRPAVDESGIAKLMNMGTAEEIRAAQAYALQRTIEFFKSAIQRRQVSPAPSPPLKPAGNSRCMLIIVAVSLFVVLAGSKRTLRLK